MTNFKRLNEDELYEVSGGESEGIKLTCPICGVEQWFSPNAYYKKGSLDLLKCYASLDNPHSAPKKDWKQ